MAPKCPKGCKGIVYELGGSSTLMCYTPFYDENGKKHYHDDNETWTEWECDVCHHHWTTKSEPNKCWCGWPDNNDVKYTAEDEEWESEAGVAELF